MSDDGSRLLLVRFLVSLSVLSPANFSPVHINPVHEERNEGLGAAAAESSRDFERGKVTFETIPGSQQLLTLSDNKDQLGIHRRVFETAVPKKREQKKSRLKWCDLCETYPDCADV